MTTQPNQTEYGEFLVPTNPYIMLVKSNKATEIIRIASDGRIFWREREVETDTEFRLAMLELAKFFQGKTQ